MTCVIGSPAVPVSLYVNKRKVKQQSINSS